MSAAFRLRPVDPIRRVMDFPRLSAGGLRFLDLPVSAVEFYLPSEDRRVYWAGAQTTTELPRFAPVRCGRGGCFLYSGVLVSAQEILGFSCLTGGERFLLL